MIKLILASQSPRRRELIGLLRLPYEAISADVDESLVTDVNPAVNVVETARMKANAVAERLRGRPGYADALIVAADTTVALDGHMLGKPVDTADAQRMLVALRDRSHDVHTGVALLRLGTRKEVYGVNTAVVTMRNYSDVEMQAYINTGGPLDKAGAYAIQHPVFRPVAQLDGCFTGVMGLSICQLLQLLPQLEVSAPADLTTLSRAHQHYPCTLLEEIINLNHTYYG